MTSCLCAKPGETHPSCPAHGRNPTICARCLGSGQAWYPNGGPHGIGSRSKCDACDGTGKPPALDGEETCDAPNREAAMVVVHHDDNNIPTVWCDPCIAPLVDALQEIGTVASCCGHGKGPGNIALADGRELMILPDFESARRAERLVKLEGIDKDRLDLALTRWDDVDADYITMVARQVLAALDGEDETPSPDPQRVDPEWVEKVRTLKAREIDGEET